MRFLFSKSIQITTVICTLFFTVPMMAGQYDFSPTVVVEKQVSHIQIEGYQRCPDTFSHIETIVSGTEITLRFARHLGATICPMMIDPNPYGPVFTIPPLDTGHYTVWKSVIPECALQIPACKMADTRTQLNTYLTVVPIQKFDGWIISPDTLLPSARDVYPMHIVNPSLGTCQNSSAKPAVVVSKNIKTTEIFASFYHVIDEQRVCIVDQKPWGPTFDIPYTDLKVGTYPVYLTVLPECSLCEVGTACCKIAVPLPSYTGNLTISNTTTLLEKSKHIQPIIYIDKNNIALKGLNSPIKFAALYTVSGEKLIDLDCKNQTQNEIKWTLDTKINAQPLVLRVHTYENSLNFYLP